ncbi:MAG TPA: hypothetical protein VFU65_14130, partial [Actinocrinis sp.]|nr:hypothetical protein [Actinocrinis sp.]
MANTFNADLRRMRAPAPPTGPRRAPAGTKVLPDQLSAVEQTSGGMMTAAADSARSRVDEPEAADPARGASHGPDEDRGGTDSHQEAPLPLCLPAAQPASNRRGIGNNLLTALTVAVLGSRQRRGLASTAVKIHGHVVQQHRAEAGSEVIDGEAALVGSQPAARSLASALITYAHHCDANGQYAEATLATEEAVTVYRRLASTHPDTYNAHL